MKKGKVILNHVRASSQYPDAITFNITRKPIKGMEQLISLAPSWDIIKLVKNAKNVADVWDEYTKRYNEELNTQENLNALLWTISYFLELGYDVQFVCFCTNPKFCHRSIVGEMFENRGYEVIGKAKE